MNGLRTSRVVIIDDQEDEAKILIKALNKIGVSTTFFNANIEEFPNTPLEGVRVVYLDLRLTQSLVEGKHLIPQCIATLQKIVNLHEGLLGIILWTKHPEDEKQFKEILKKEHPNFKPIFIDSVADKLSILEKNNVNTLVNVITNLFDTKHAYNFLWDWEQAVYDSTLKSTSLLTHANKDSSDLMKLYRSLLLAFAGKQMTSNNLCIPCLYEALGMIHQDQIIQKECCVNSSKAYAESIYNYYSTQTGGTDLNQIAKFNRVLLTSNVDTESTPSPGCLYTKSNWNRKKFFLDTPKEKKEFISEIWHGDEDKIQEIIEYILENSIPCLLEITPTCDHAQNKAKEFRLIGGLLVKCYNSKSKNKGLTIPHESKLFSKQLETIEIENESANIKGYYMLVLNARFLSVIPQRSLKKSRALLRLRQEVMNDIRVWFSSHATRPGYVSLR